MAKEEKKVDAEVADAEDIKEYMEEDYQESGYKEHSFSLFDNPIEIVTVIYVILYLVYAIWKFTDICGNRFAFDEGIEYWLGVVGKLIPAVILLVAAEIYEKIQMMEYNIKLNSYYMAEYQMDLIHRLEPEEEDEKAES